jgi:hypothetical protein
MLIFYFDEKRFKNFKGNIKKTIGVPEESVFKIYNKSFQQLKPPDFSRNDEPSGGHFCG